MGGVDMDLLALSHASSFPFPSSVRQDGALRPVPDPVFGVREPGERAWAAEQAQRKEEEEGGGRGRRRRRRRRRFGHEEEAAPA